MRGNVVQNNAVSTNQQLNQPFMPCGNHYHTHFCSSMDDSATAYTGGIWTAPKYRRKGINAFVASEILRYLRGKGILRAITVVIKGNIAEENCQLKLGSYLRGEGHQLRLLPLFNFWWLKSKSRAVPE